MPENCDKNGCGALESLEDRFAALERRNGEDHRMMREDIHKLELEYAEQRGQLGMIMGTLNEVKGDSKNILEKLTNITTKVDKVDDLENDVSKLEAEIDAINSKPGETWEHIKKQGIGWILGVICAIVAVALGLKEFL